MPATSQVTITGVKAGLPFGSESIGPLTILNTASGDAVTDLSSLNGDNTIAVPSWAIGVIISLPAGNTTALKLKGASGDTGVSLHLTNPSVLSLPASQTTFILNVAGAGVAITFMWF